MKQIFLKANRLELSLSSEASEALFDYRWPGNVRELRNALERAMALAHMETITLNDLPDSIYKTASQMFISSANGMQLKEREREHIVRVLTESPTLEQAAATLGINVTM